MECTSVLCTASSIAIYYVFEKSFINSHCYKRCYKVVCDLVFIFSVIMSEFKKLV